MASDLERSVTIVSPLFPPARGGLADHTLRLAEALSSRINVSVLTSIGSDAGTRFPVFPEIRDWTSADAICARLREITPGRSVVWQYVPQMYGRGGVNLALPRMAHRLASEGWRQLVIAHEIAAPPSLWPNRMLYRWSHLYQWRAWLRHAAFIGVSTEAWLVRETGRRPERRAKLGLLPSPAGIRTVASSPAERDEWKRRHSISENASVLTFFGGVSVFKQVAWVVEAWRAAQAPGRPVTLIIVGGAPGVEVPDALQPLFRPLGYLPEAEASLALQVTDVLALPFIDGVSERRTSFMAGLSHRCAVVTTIGHSTGPALRSSKFFGRSPANDRPAFVRAVHETLDAPDRRRTWAAAGAAAYAKDYDWPNVVETLVRRLELTGG